MITPQQIEQISFGKQPFGGYDMEQVDEFLEPLTEDYITLYKENALLKSKMRVLVAKLEEYRANEASMKDAIVNAQKTCDMMVKEAEAKCAQMLSEAAATASANLSSAESLVAEEAARVDEARLAASASIEQIEGLLRSCLETLAQIRTGHCAVAPEAVVTEATETTEVPAEDPVKSFVDDIMQQLEIPVAEDVPVDTQTEVQEESIPTSPKPLKFGPNYDPLNP